MTSPFQVGQLHVYPIQSPLVAMHLLYQADTREAVLIDTGLVGEMGMLRRALARLGIAWSDIKAILLTHGHADHTGNLAAIKRLTGAPLFAHPLEQVHIDNKYPYVGWAQGCAVLENVGRGLLRYQPVKIDEPLHDGMLLPFWDGLQVVHLPGHSHGHCGFLSPRLNLLFSGDLFASYWFSVHRPYFFLNSCPELFPETFRKVGKMAPRYVIPNHYSVLDPILHQQALTKLIERETVNC